MKEKSFGDLIQTIGEYADQQAKKEAIAFAEWKDKNYWFQDGDFMWFQDVNTINRKTTEQLYELFEQQTKEHNEKV